MSDRIYDVVRDIMLGCQPQAFKVGDKVRGSFPVFGRRIKFESAVIEDLDDWGFIRIRLIRCDAEPGREAGVHDEVFVEDTSHLEHIS